MPSDRRAADLVISAGMDDGAVVGLSARNPPPMRSMEPRPHRGSPTMRSAQLAVAADRISEARRNLARAHTVPDVRRVMEAASVAADAARRVAKLAEGESSAIDLVEAAADAANDAAGLRIEAQAKAGELLREMAERGERDLGRGGDRRSRSQAATVNLGQIGVTKSESSRWQQVAEVAVEMRRQYVAEIAAARGEVTTAGLLRYASGTEAESGAVDPVEVHAEARRQIRRVYRGLRQLPGYAPRALVSALDEGERQDLVATLAGLEAWMADVRGELAVYRPANEEEE